MYMVESLPRFGSRGGKEKPAMAEQENTELVRRAYERFLQGEILAVLGGPRGKPSTQEDLTPITGKLLSDSRPFGW
jgi:hypothetical protein